MKGLFLLLGSGLLATTLAVAQDMPASSNPDTSQSQETTQSTQTTSGVLRGCLSGSAGNYTITDQNGMQYQINGPDNQLQASVGHEIEVTTRQDQSSASSTQGDQTTSSATNSVQVSNLRDIAKTCTKGNSMDNGSGTTPKGTPDAADPPRIMAMLRQQESKPDMSQNPQQTTPPVTSQTPATPGASTNSAQQAPSSNTAAPGQQTAAPSNNTGTSGSQVDQSGQSSTASPSAAPSNPQQPSANDQNKPLYERQATDVPWASHSGDNTGNTGKSNPPPQQ